MSESCLVLSPPARNEGMQRESGMGINSRGAVSDVGAVLDPDTSLRRKQSVNNSSTSVKQMKAPRVMTENDSRDSQMKGSQERPQSYRENVTSESIVHKRKLETLGLGKSDEEEEEGKQGSSGSSAERHPSLPQHKQIQAVEPMDISYCATPATLRLKDVLMTRLDAVILTGRIQVVSSISIGAWHFFRMCRA